MADAPMIRVLGFKTKYGKNPKTGENNREIDYVEFAPAQALNAQSTVERVDFLRPKFTDNDDDTPNMATKKLHMEAIWSVIGPAYEAWKKGFEIPTSGTPLAAWAGVTSDQANALRKLAIYTVEDLASLSDDKFPRVPMPNVREVRDLARRYLDTGEDTRTAERLNDLEKSNAALAEQLAAAVALLSEQAAKPKRQKQAEAA
jgi:hypothetical protein